jgi:uncharacterized protein (TIGR02284 family)
MKHEKPIEVLTTLIGINNDRIQGYKTASRETEDEDLKSLFLSLQSTSQKCKAELVREIERLGGTPNEGASTKGNLFRLWMDVKVALTGKDRKAIIDSCEYGEDIAESTYNKALNDHPKELSSEQQKMIGDQFHLIKEDHDKVKEIRNALASV